MVIDAAALGELIGLLKHDGYRTWGPVVRDGAISPGPLSDVADLPRGWHDEQAPGSYRLRHDGDPALFSWAVGPGSWKSRFLPPAQTVWTAPPAGAAAAAPPDPDGGAAPLAMIGVRPCELAAMSVLDRVLRHSPVPDPGYRDRRAGNFVVVAECSSPASTCFCSSMGAGPAAGAGFDLALMELGDPAGRFVVRVGSGRGAELLRAIPGARPASGDDLAAREEALGRARSAMVRTVDASGVAGLLARNIDHPRWQEVAERCLACGNCTMVCPTCFCTDLRAGSDLHGGTSCERSWSSCFDADHSYVHGGPVRRTRASRYRQWLTHKLSTWWDQFGSSGCVGCGRCITWCPVGIDITEEVAAIAASDGAGGAAGSTRR